MALQSVQINVIQDSSGSGVRVAWSWTSDGNAVKNGKLYFRQPGGYTLDADLVQVLANRVAELVRDTLRTEQLF